MAITYVGAGALAIGTGAINVNSPTSLQVGDLLILFVGSDNQAIPFPTSSTPSTGNRVWTEIGNQANQGTGTPGTGATSARIGVYYRFASGSVEPVASVADSGNVTMGRMIALRGVHKPDPFVTSSAAIQAATTTNPSFPGFFIAPSRAYMVYGLQTGRDATNTNNFNGFTANVNLQNVVEQIDQTSTTGNGGGFVVWTANVTSSVNIGTFTVTKTTAWSDGISMMTLALRPRKEVILN